MTRDRMTRERMKREEENKERERWQPGGGGKNKKFHLSGNAEPLTQLDPAAFVSDAAQECFPLSSVTSAPPQAPLHLHPSSFPISISPHSPHLSLSLSLSLSDPSKLTRKTKDGQK